jgi:hypothetical protein
MEAIISVISVFTEISDAHVDLVGSECRTQHQSCSRHCWGGIVEPECIGAQTSPRCEGEDVISFSATPKCNRMTGPPLWCRQQHLFSPELFPRPDRGRAQIERTCIGHGPCRLLPRSTPVLASRPGRTPLNRYRRRDGRRIADRRRRLVGMRAPVTNIGPQGRVFVAATGVSSHEGDSRQTRAWTSDWR